MHASNSDTRNAAGGPFALIFAAGVMSGMLFVLALTLPNRVLGFLQALLSASDALGSFIIGSPLVWAGLAFMALLANSLAPGRLMVGLRHDRELN